jgi:hypothetical protein
MITLYFKYDIQWNLYLSFPDNSFSWIRRSISMVPERILFELWLPHILFSRIHCFFFRTPMKTMNRGFTVYQNACYHIPENRTLHTLLFILSLTIRCVLSVFSECADNEQMSQQLQHIFHGAWHRRGSRNRGWGGRCARQGTRIPRASRIKCYHRGALPTNFMAGAFLFLHLAIYNPETTHSVWNHTNHPGNVFPD